MAQNEAGQERTEAATPKRRQKAFDEGQVAKSQELTGAVVLLTGMGMLAGVLDPLVSATALFIGGVGAASVIKAVYIDKRELRCACVGGNSNVPLGFISLTENLMMLLMGLRLAIG